MKEQDSKKSAGRTWFQSLPSDQKWSLGDALVLGTFDWREWGFEKKPSSAFLQGVEYARILWESSASF